jgi:hypothetical protein
MQVSRSHLGALRRAAVNKGLIVALVVMVIAASGYWIWHVATADKVAQYDPNADTTPVTLLCTECKTKSQVTRGELYKLPRSEDRAFFECPKCKKTTAAYQRSGTTSLSAP